MIDGSGNNVKNPTWGNSGAVYLRASSYLPYNRTLVRPNPSLISSRIFGFKDPVVPSSTPVNALAVYMVCTPFPE
jgi:hypothetical protein